MQMVAEREAKQMTLTEEDTAYNSADIQDLPKPPYIFKVRGHLRHHLSMPPTLFLCSTKRSRPKCQVCCTVLRDGFVSAS